MCALDVSNESMFTLTSIPAASTSEVIPSYPSLSVITKYMIKSRQASESAWIFFTEDPTTSKSLVMKVLRPYSDTRYNLSCITERQHCQLEALQQNRIFTPEVYLGLARLYNQPSEENYILLGEIIQRPSQERLDQDAEYALIMEWLPEERRLDQLLKEDEYTVNACLYKLVSHIVSLHKHQTLSLTAEESAYWGGYQNLQRKLEENLAFLALVLDKVNSSSLKATIERLITGLHKIFTEEYYAPYFERRLQAGHIKHCHGDIKSLNIWIMPDDYQQHLSVKLLDAIDFNPLFRNIDTLSDFAMLVIDVQARTWPAGFARSIIDTYLQLTDQDDMPTRAILEFYLAEKAIISATINILFDNELELGMRLLHLAEEYLDQLLHFWLF